MYVYYVLFGIMWFKPLFIVQNVYFVGIFSMDMDMDMDFSMDKGNRVQLRRAIN